MSFELVVDGVGHGHVLEHPLQLAGELAAAFALQLRNHHLLRVIYKIYKKIKDVAMT